MNQAILIEEYKTARAEVGVRVQMLHTILSLAAVMQLVALVVYFWLFRESGDQLFLLLLPLIFAVLTFNYQANQMTMEAVAVFSDSLRNHLTEGSDVPSWDSSYGAHKPSYQLTSFLKTLPLFLPLILPFILLVVNGGLYDKGTYNGLLLIDIVIFLLVIFNFRYKFPQKKP